MGEYADEAINRMMGVDGYISDRRRINPPTRTAAPAEFDNLDTDEALSSESRLQFEAWVLRRAVCKRHGAHLRKNKVGHYLDYRVNDRWLAWEAGRAALVGDLI